jgi:hypothetical protein
MVRPRQVAARKRSRHPMRQPQKTTVESIHPRVVRPAWNREREQTKARTATHRRDIAQAPGERLMAYVLRRVGVAPEMNVLKEQVAREQQIVTRAARSKDRAIVADSPDHSRVRRDQNLSYDVFQDFSFT